jgi:hypothetical protein
MYRRDLQLNFPLDLFRELVSRGGADLTVAGPSMEPTVARGARVRVTPCPDPRAGDVVVLHTRGGLVVHRLWARLPGVLVHGGEGGAPGLARPRDLVGRAGVARREISVSRRALATFRATLLYCHKWLPWRFRVALQAKRRSEPFSVSKTASPE